MPLDLSQLARDPAAFRSALIIPSAHGPARFGGIMAEFQRADFQRLDPSVVAVSQGSMPLCTRFWWERTKGASKDTDAAISVLWLLAFSRRPLFCQVGAADRDQADEVRKIVKGILRLNEWLSEVVNVQSYVISNTLTESRCEIIPADVAGSHGARPDLLILNELSHITKREFAENLLDNAAKVPRGVVLIATNAGFIPSWQWDLRQTVAGSDRWAFSAYAKPAPWLPDEIVAERRAQLSPARFNRLWCGEWVSEGDALSLDRIDAAVIPDLIPAEGPEPGWTYVCGVDLSLSRDHSAVVVIGKHVGRYEDPPAEPEPELPHPWASAVDLGLIPAPQRKPAPEPTYHPGSGKLRLVHTRVWRPRGGQVDLQAIESHVAELHARFNLSMVLADQWQAALMIQRLNARGVESLGVQFTTGLHSEMASEVLSAFNDGRIELYSDDELLRDLRRAQVIDRASGVRLQWPRGRDGHGDLGTAFGLALVAAKKSAFRLASPPEHLLVWP